MRAVGASGRPLSKAEYALGKLAALTNEEEKRAPGWYVDPSGGSRYEMFWDGRRWTGETRRTDRSRRRSKAFGVFFVTILLAGFVALVTAFTGEFGPAVAVLVLGSVIALGTLLSEGTDSSSEASESSSDDEALGEST